MPAERTWVVTTSSSRPIDAIAAELEEAGFTVDQILEAIGSIIGRSGAASIARLQAIDGVTDVAPSGDIDIGPPGKDPTW